MRLVLLLTLILFMGCQTIHEYCSDTENLSRYKDYDQCYSERQLEQEKSRLRYANSLRAFGESLKGPDTVTCTSQTYGYQTVTKCQ